MSSREINADNSKASRCVIICIGQMELQPWTVENPEKKKRNISLLRFKVLREGELALAYRALFVACIGSEHAADPSKPFESCLAGFDSCPIGKKSSNNKSQEVPHIVFLKLTCKSVCNHSMMFMFRPDSDTWGLMFCTQMSFHFCLVMNQVRTASSDAVRSRVQ